MEIPGLELDLDTTISFERLQRYKTGWNTHRKPIYVPTKQQTGARTQFSFFGVATSSTAVTYNDVRSGDEQPTNDEAGWNTVQRRGPAAPKSGYVSDSIRRETMEPTGGSIGLIQLTVVTDPDEEAHAQWVLGRPMNPYRRWQKNPDDATVRSAYS